jgi:hypothetical protein
MSIEDELRQRLHHPEHRDMVRNVMTDLRRSAAEHGVDDALLGFELLAHGWAVLLDQAPDEAHAAVVREFKHVAARNRQTPRSRLN